MINAGAIACAGLVAGASEDGLETLLDAYGRYAGRSLAIDEAVYRSESETGHRNRAIAHLLSSFDVLGVSAEEAVDLYFRQCSVALDCRDLALVAATLANGGLNPVTGERAVGEAVVREVLSVMTTCGMYDGAGDWIVSVGLPAKSGVSGGVFAVLPGRLGVAVYSPPLDANGNSVRGVAVCRALSHELALHIVRPGERDALPVRARHDISTRSSKRIRPPRERALLAAAAGRTAIFELQGELGFMAAEAISRATAEAPSPVELAVVDLRRVTRVDRGGADFLRALGDALSAAGGGLALSGAAPGIAVALPHGLRQFPDLDAALEWCEDEILLRHGSPSTPTSVPLAEHELLHALDSDELARLVPQLGRIEADAGTLVTRSGDVAEDVYLVTSGTLSVRAPGSGPAGRRFSTLSAGMTFGEVAYVERGPRSADVYADTAVVCHTLPFAVLDRLATSDPVVYAKLVHALAGVVVAALRRANAEAAHLDA
jgi:glutaminase